MKSRFLNMLCAFATVLQVAAQAQEPSISIEPRHYVCYKTNQQVTIDGLLRETCWQHAAWSETFVDIEGSLRPLPALKTRVKMLWDNEYLYIAAQLEEPNVWATLTQRESVIFYDNDFEVFIDPDGDTHHYLEYEMNALNTQWDLMLLKPYRDEDSANVTIDNWNYNGIKSSVYVDGTLNDPLDTDQGWTIEIAIPLDALAEVSAHGKMPVDGEQYRINFSRVEWKTAVVDSKYRKLTHWVNGVEKPLPEDNWVWSPQGVIAMHQPETWGFVQFSSKNSGDPSVDYMPNPDNAMKWALRLLYYREKAFYEKHHQFTPDLKELGLDTYMIDNQKFIPEIKFTFSSYEAIFPASNPKHNWHITGDGRIWKK